MGRALDPISEGGVYFFMIFKNGSVLLDDYTFLKTDVKVSNKKIAEIGDNLGGDEIVDLKGNYLLPGFIEEHFHGANGAAVLDCKKESFLKLSDFFCAIFGYKTAFTEIDKTSFIDFAFLIFRALSVRSIYSGL